MPVRGLLGFHWLPDAPLAHTHRLERALADSSEQPKMQYVKSYAEHGPLTGSAGWVAV